MTVINVRRLRRGNRFAAKNETIAPAKSAATNIENQPNWCGAAHFSAHDLRRSCAERLVGAGVAEREVSRVLRHSSTDTTRKYYAPGTVQESAGIIRKRLVGKSR
jgi:integrase